MTSEVVSPGEFSAVKADLSEIKDAVKQMATALARLATLDERQQAMASTTREIASRLGQLETRQHEKEVRDAANGDLGSRVKLLEEGFREGHMERQVDKARFQTVVWMLRGVWVVIGGAATAWATGYLK